MRRSVALLLILLALGAACDADEPVDRVWLQRGAYLEGTILEVTDEEILMKVKNAPAFRVEPFSRIARQDVVQYDWVSLAAREERCRKLQEELRPRLRQLRDEDQPGILALAEWCEKHSLEIPETGVVCPLGEAGRTLYCELAQRGGGTREVQRAQARLRKAGYAPTQSYGWARVEEIWVAHGFQPWKERWVTPEFAQADEECDALEAGSAEEPSTQVDAAEARDTAREASAEARELRRLILQVERDLVEARAGERQAAAELCVDLRDVYLDTLELDGRGLWGRRKIAKLQLAQRADVNVDAWPAFCEYRELRRTGEAELEANQNRLAELAGQVPDLEEAAVAAKKAAVEQSSAQNRLARARARRDSAEAAMQRQLGPDGLPRPNPGEAFQPGSGLASLRQAFLEEEAAEDD